MKDDREKLKSEKDSEDITDLSYKAKELIPKQVQNRHDFASKDLQSLVHELETHQIELEMQNSELRRIQHDLEESQRLYSDLFDFAPTGYFIFDRSGTVCSVNFTGVKMLGYDTKYEVIDRPFSVFVLPEDWEIFFEHLRDTFERQIKQVNELRLVRANRSIINVQLQSIISDETGDKHATCRTTILDITEIKQAQEQIKHSEQEIQNILNSITDIYIAYDREWRFVDLNRQAEKAIGKKRDEVIGKTFGEVFPKMLDSEYNLQYQKATKSMTPVHFEAKFKANKWFEIHAYPSKDRFFVYMKDISIRKKAENILSEQAAKLQQRSEQLEKTNKELESFSYSISHDLRAPLRAIDGFAKMILVKDGNNLSEYTKEKFEVIRANASKMGQLIDSLLEFSRLGRQALSLKDINMDDLVKEVWNELLNFHLERKMSFIMDELPKCYGDRHLIRQVLANLLGNAIKFTKDRNMALIEVGGYIKGKEHVYYIKDNGAGFDMMYYDKLFSVFRRLHNPEEFEGTGIGLAIVQRVIHKHGGRVWAEGKVDQGACFYFALPYLCT